MQLTKVWRVHHWQTGLGPYGCYDNPKLREALHLAHSGCPNHPDPRAAGEPWFGLSWAQIREAGKDEIFGFSSPESALLWFDGWMPVLEGGGFGLVSLVVRKQTIRWGRYQISFIP